MRCLLPLVALLAGLLVPAAPGQASPPAPQCQGKRATIVGEPGVQRLRGTSRPDVIVSNGALYVDALGGADRVCVTRRGAFVRAGAGDDRVKVVTDVRDSGAALGSGRDVYVGGDRADDIFANDGQPDVVRTGPGPDHVVAGRLSAGMADRVLLGPGPDTFDLRSDRTVGRGEILGGPGVDILRGERGLSGGGVVVDAVDGTATRDGKAFLRFDGLEQYSLDFGSAASVRFEGTDRDEYAHFLFATISGDLGGGDDTIVGDFGPEGTTEELSGGAGFDSLVLEGSDVVFDAASGSASGGVPLGSAVYDGFEWLHGIGTTVEMNGSAAGETLVGFGCEVTVHGLGGDDSLRSYAGPESDLDCEATSGALHGGEGDDELFGDGAPDTLIGGEGEDRADGGGGIDVCEAEVVRRCEG